MSKAEAATEIPRAGIRLSRFVERIALLFVWALLIALMTIVVEQRSK